MNWIIDQKASREAARIFDGFTPIVKRNGRQYLVEKSPYGTIELIPLQHSSFLAAATSPPRHISILDASRLTMEMRAHLRRNHLNAWKITSGASIPEVLQNLMRDESFVDFNAIQPTWSKYALFPTARGVLIGESRLQIAHQLVGLVQARDEGSPIPALTSVRGVGKHTVVEHIADELELSLVELPLNRILIDRIFETPQESFLDTVLVANAKLSEKELLVVSNAEQVLHIPKQFRQWSLNELARLHNVLLIADSYNQTLLETANVVALSCPGLFNKKEILELLKISHPDLQLMGSALDTVCREATVPGYGIVPARLLFLVRLAHSLVGVSDGSNRPMTFSPDEATPAAMIARQAWEQHETDTMTDSGA